MIPDRDARQILGAERIHHDSHAPRLESEVVVADFVVEVEAVLEPRTTAWHDAHSEDRFRSTLFLELAHLLRRLGVQGHDRVGRGSGLWHRFAHTACVS